MSQQEPICVVVDDVLTPAACAAVIASAEGQGFAPASPVYPATYRNNSRLVRDDAALSAALLERLRPHLPARLPDGAGVLSGLNTRFRLCRYRDGQSFTVHQDGAWHPSPGARSRLTVMLYLNGDDAFSGGETRFYTQPGGPVWRRVAPRTGRLIVFDHALWHDGAPVYGGQKYILRTDVIYTCDQTDLIAEGGHRGYIWCAVRGGDGRLVTGGRDRSVRLWSAQGRPEVREDVHGLSVLALTVDGQERLWSASRDGTMRCWPGDSWLAHGGAAVLCLLGLGAGGAVVSGGADGAVWRWSAPGQGERLGGHDGWVRALCGDGRTFWSGGEDGVVRRWPDGAVVWRAPTGTQVWSLAVSPRLGVVAGLADGRIVGIEDMAGEGGRSWQAHGAGVRALTVDGAGRLWSGGEDGRVCCREAAQEWTVPGFVSALVATGPDREEEEEEMVVVGYGGMQRLSLPRASRRAG